MSEHTVYSFRGTDNSLVSGTFRDRERALRYAEEYKYKVIATTYVIDTRSEVVADFTAETKAEELSL